MKLYIFDSRILQWVGHRFLGVLEGPDGRFVGFKVLLSGSLGRTVSGKTLHLILDKEKCRKENHVEVEKSDLFLDKVSIFVPSSSSALANPVTSDV